MRTHLEMESANLPIGRKNTGNFHARMFRLFMVCHAVFAGSGHSSLVAPASSGRSNLRSAGSPSVTNRCTQLVRKSGPRERILRPYGFQVRMRRDGIAGYRVACPGQISRPEHPVPLRRPLCRVCALLRFRHLWGIFLLRRSLCD
jgi:hypothetical protein